MDPNETLRRMRKTARHWDTVNYDEEDYYAIADEMAELIQAMDEWLSKGGFPPDDWKIR